jgi:DNA-binding IclR family transcriptional regulator
MGKALLAGLAIDDFAARYPDPVLLAMTANTITSRDELEMCLAEAHFSR